MFRRLMIAALALLLAAPALASDECPGCDPVDAWFAENGPHCNYHGARLPSICELDPACLDWNRRCEAKREELRACVARCMAGDHRVLDGGHSGASELDAFDRAMAELRRTGYAPGAYQQSPDWCRRQQDRLAEVNPIRFGTYANGLIARVVAVSGDVRVQLCDGRSVGAAENMLLVLGTCIETGGSGRIRIRMNDLDLDTAGIGPSFLNLGRNSRICIDDFEITRRDGTEKALINLSRGHVRVALDGWNRGNAFHVKAGDAVVGVRGSALSEVIVRIEPSDGSIQAGAIAGRAWLGNLSSREIRQIQGGEWAQDTAAGIGPVQPLSRADWNATLANDGLDL